LIRNKFKLFERNTGVILLLNPTWFRFKYLTIKYLLRITMETCTIEAVFVKAEPEEMDFNSTAESVQDSNVDSCDNLFEIEESKCSIENLFTY
jgi:hypothetical protein